MTTSGIPNASHRRTKRAAFSALSEFRQPPSRSGLLASTPTVRPDSRPSPTTIDGAQLAWNSSNGVSSSRIAVTIGCTS